MVLPARRPDDPPASIVQTQVNGRTYAMKSVAQCKTCQHPNRFDIEEMMCQGRSYRTIMRALPEGPEWDDLNPSYEALRQHFVQEHMPLPQAARRRLIERNYEKSGRKIEEAVDDLIDNYVTVAELVVQRGVERLNAGEIEPEVSDVLNAVKTLHAINQSSQAGVDQDVWQNVMMTYMEEVSRIMNPDQLQALGKRLNQNPMLKALAAKREQSNIIEGDVA